MNDVIESELIPVGEKPVTATPTDNYRHRTGWGAPGIILERCWIVGDKLEWREVPVVDGEIVDE